MDTQTLKQLQKSGNASTSVAQFLGLSKPEEALVEIKAHFTALLKAVRIEQNLSQAELAKRLDTSQQAIARAEGASSSASFEFVIRALLTMNLSIDDLGEEMCALHAELHPEEVELTLNESPCSGAHSVSEHEMKIIPFAKIISSRPDVSGVTQFPKFQSMSRGSQEHKSKIVDAKCQQPSTEDDYFLEAA